MTFAHLTLLGIRHWLVPAVVGVPSFAIILEEGYGIDRKNPLTGPPLSSQAQGWVKGGDRHCPFLDCQPVFQILGELNFFYAESGSII